MIEKAAVKIFCRFIIFAVVFETLKIGYGPFVFPIVDNADFGRCIRPDDLIQFCKILAKLRYFTEYARVFTAFAVNDCAVEFFGSAARFAPLEILNGVRAVRHRLQGGKPVHSRTLHLVDVCPVDTARCAFHEHKRTA